MILTITGNTQFFQERNEKTQVALGGKKTTNLFRVVSPNQKRFRLNVRDFNEVIRLGFDEKLLEPHSLSVDAKNRFCEVEGMTTYEDLVAATLAHGNFPSLAFAPLELCSSNSTEMWC